jgi:hypothetical protein
LGISEQEFHILLTKYFDTHINMYHTLQINFATAVKTVVRKQNFIYNRAPIRWTLHCTSGRGTLQVAVFSVLGVIGLTCQWVTA